MQRRAFLSATVACAIVASAFQGTSTQAAPQYPDKPVNIIVPFPPGGLTDLIGRRFAAYLEKKTGQTVVVQNRAGASGQVGAQAIARMEPDGYNLLVTATHFAISAAVRADLPYDPVGDFDPIAIFVTTPNILVVNEKVPVHSLREYIEYANKKPGGMSFGSSGTGGSTHLSGELLKHLTGANLQHVSYRGMVPHVNDLVGGQIESGFVDPSSVIQFLQEGRLRALAVTGAQRFDILPDIATIAEQGVDGYEATTWIALAAPAGTPQAVKKFLNQAAIESMQTPEGKEFLQQISATPSTLTDAQVKDYLKAEIDKWKKVAEAANLRTGN
ncbi:Bug family tripartite tricarboxylate transporter substrate binding protein [Bordetella petrii]|uniref:Bug family tripartite tricarboxylate transporter substrate binding protein n=1 Tax=Bordetella petrii TaxID=94624 RepID=UPI0004BA1F12|nr:tripartite tricarboxylate transporter substrate binding protein [Bordetella petrii]